MRGIDFGMNKNSYIDLSGNTSQSTANYFAKSVDIGHTYKPTLDSLGQPVFSNNIGYKPSSDNNSHSQKVLECQATFTAIGGIGGTAFKTIGPGPGAVIGSTVGGALCPYVVRSKEEKIRQEREAAEQKAAIEKEAQRKAQEREALRRSAMWFI